MAHALVSSPAWQELLRHKEALAAGSLRDLVLATPNRLDAMQLACDGLRLNFALNYATPKTVELLVRLASQQNIETERARMFAGERINASENRAVLHTALRQKDDTPVRVDGQDVIPEIRATRARMEAFARAVRDGRWLGATGKPIRHVVNIGIGGSDLGPRLAVKALAPFAQGPRVDFVANADAFELINAVRGLDPAETLFVVVSKTFTTQETLLNAQSARDWLTGKLGADAVGRHFVAVSVNRREVEAFGIVADNIFPIWDWIGGRYSLWSAVGLSIMLAIGPQHFGEMLAGAAEMDAHFRTAPLAQNMPVLLAMLGIWNRDFLNTTALAVLPYAERLRDFPRYLQQLEMESNGKTATREGKPAGVATVPVLFGECGTVGQHSFHQCLHQGSDIIPADFIGVATDDLGHPHHHRALNANMVAQACALAFGRPEAATLNDVYPGGRPSNLILLDRLDPFHFGMLVALYEHKVFTQGIVWNLNSFDQPGVELGKKMARSLDTPPAGGDRAAAIMSQLFRASTAPNCKKIN
ncbi:MAG: glucose-6-phosphate isomerase [Bdellovibrionales bacterium]